MKYSYAPIIAIGIVVILFHACGPGEEEKQEQEKARQDSLEQVEQQMQQQRQDNLAKVQQNTQTKARENTAAGSMHETGRYALQVASWRSLQKANAEVRQWKDRGFEHATVVEYGDDTEGDVWFRVRLGKTESREAAQRVQKMLQQEYQVESWIATI